MKRLKNKKIYMKPALMKIQMMRVIKIKMGKNFFNIEIKRREIKFKS